MDTYSPLVSFSMGSSLRAEPIGAGERQGGARSAAHPCGWSRTRSVPLTRPVSADETNMNKELIESFLLQRYPGNGRPKAVRDEIAGACNAFVKSGLADSNFIKGLCSGSEQRFWSRVSEALLAARLKNIGLSPEPSHGGERLGTPHTFTVYSI